MKPEGADRASRALSIYPLPFLAKVQTIPQTPKYKRTSVNNKLAHIGSTCRTMKRTCTFTKQYDANIIFHKFSQI
ncbi:unnamed protein product [Musa textilis]